MYAGVSSAVAGWVYRIPLLSRQLQLEIFTLFPSRRWAEHSVDQRTIISRANGAGKKSEGRTFKEKDGEGDEV